MFLVFIWLSTAYAWEASFSVMHFDKLIQWKLESFIVKLLVTVNACCIFPCDNRNVNRIKVLQLVKVP